MKLPQTLRRWGRALPGIGFLALAALPVGAAEPAPSGLKRPNEREVAQRVDVALTRALGKNAPLPPLADDPTFLRRASFDVTGMPPSPEAVRAFAADPDPDRRARLVDRLLASDAYAVNWGRYWRDTITYHTAASGNYLRWQLFDRWLTEQVRRNRPWGEIVTALVTADGINDECAPVNYLTCHFGNPVEVAATTSRVFLGVQLQCAQCHDAKTESWKREQFHQFVAFFGRARIIQHKDLAAARGTPYAIEGRADGQYCMTDKKDPGRLIPMAPRFLTGEEVSADAPDAVRRAALARFLTSPKSPWFARAYVNRMWTALMGWGFYPGVNDLGSGQPQYPEVLDLLAAEWTATGYDMRWLFRTLTQTQAYQRQLQPRPRSRSGSPPAVCPSRLRPEQIFDALVRALGFDENDKTIPAPAPSTAPAVARHSGLRHMVYQAFKTDPSLPVDELEGTIPQALVLMNSALVHTFTAANGKTFLGEALARGMSDDDIVIGMYERTLARKPTAEELAICQRYLNKVKDRKEALEDVFWSLVNSTEFLTKR
jgi:hypothetical protein